MWKTTEFVLLELKGTNKKPFLIHCTFNIISVVRQGGHQPMWLLSPRNEANVTQEVNFKFNLILSFETEAL